MSQGSPAWAMAQAREQHAPEPPVADIGEDLYEELPISDPVWEPVPVTTPECERSEAPAGRLHPRPASRVRGEHRSVTHVRRSGAHPRSRPHRAGLSRRFLQACRRWLWVESPDCPRSARLNAIEHGGRRHGSPVRSRTDRDIASRR
jgi:hypothetical protein